MAYIQEYFDFVNEAIRLEFMYPDGLSMFELGNQRIVSGATESVAKDHFINRGFEHTSVDLNGSDGALPLDLRNPDLFVDHYNKYHIVTNLGTTEHVEPVTTQHACFSIIHNVVKPGGIMIHMVPDADELRVSGAWSNHCNIYYTSNFFELLADSCGYTLLENTVIFGLRSVVLRKEDVGPFIAPTSIFEEHIIV